MVIDLTRNVCVETDDGDLLVVQQIQDYGVSRTQLYLPLVGDMTLKTISRSHGGIFRDLKNFTQTTPE